MKTHKFTQTSWPSARAILLLFALMACTVACTKKTNAPAPTTSNTSYVNISAFYQANAPKSQFFTIDAVNGGSFVTTQGTKVTVAPHSFVDPLNNPVTGSVKVEFMDVYKKSDMLLAQMPVMQGNGAPLKSAGEFFIRVMQDTVAMNLAANNAIVVQQPENGPVDSAMQPFVFGPLVSGGNGWQKTAKDSILWEASNASDCIFSLYNFSTPAGKGTWCNSDNATYFATYTQTTLNIIPDFVDSNGNMQVFIVFKGINSMVHVYDGGNSQYPYHYAPLGLPCTVVAVGVQGGKLYSSFTDITISANQTVNISAAETAAADFTNKLKSLDN